MLFTDVMNTTRENLQRSLDELISPRSTLRSKTIALQNLERSLASASLPFGLDSQDAKDAFFALQFTFECNVPSRLLPWIMATTSRLESLTNSNFKGQEDDGKETEIKDLSSQLAVSLSLIQGVTLNHEASKTYMGRKPSLEILLDLLLTSRHLTTGIGTDSAAADSESSPTKGTRYMSLVPLQPPLTSLILDTLLCILVDSSSALRAFEEANGVQSIVKILKRAGTPREVRMKCLEFLYFYLLDETPDPSSSSLFTNLKSTQPIPPPTAPATPVHPSSSPSPSPSSSDMFPNPKQKPYMNATPLRPSTMSRYGSSSFSFSTSTSSSASTSTTDGNRLSTSASSLASVSTSSRSTSGSSMYSFSSTSSNASSETAASSMPASPVKECFSAPETQLDRVNSNSKANNSNLLVKSPVKRSEIPSTSSPSGFPNTTATKTMTSASGSTGSNTGLRRQATPILPRSLMMLRKEVEFVPLSPKKSPSSTTNSSSSSAAPATPLAEKRVQHLQRADTTPVLGSGSGFGLGSGTKLVPRSHPRAGTRLGHRKSLSTSTLGGSSSGSGSGFGSPGAGIGVSAGERTRINVGGRVRMGMEGSLPNIPLGKGKGNTIHFGVSGGVSGEDTDVDVEGGTEKGKEEKDGNVIDRYILSSSSSSSSSTAFSSSLVKDKDNHRDKDRVQDWGGDRKWKTTEEKKELLGTMLGNVDALVEGVRKAGIWGLG